MDLSCLRYIRTIKEVSFRGELFMPLAKNALENRIDAARKNRIGDVNYAAHVLESVCNMPLEDYFQQCVPHLQIEEIKKFLNCLKQWCVWSHHWRRRPFSMRKNERSKISMEERISRINWGTRKAMRTEVHGRDTVQGNG